jgi:hypothetical protein
MRIQSLPDRPGAALLDDAGRLIAEIPHDVLAQLARDIGHALHHSRDRVADESRRATLARIMPARRTDFVDLEL